MSQMINEMKKISFKNFINQSNEITVGIPIDLSIKLSNIFLNNHSIFFFLK